MKKLSVVHNTQMQTNSLWQLMPDRIKHKICRSGNESEHAAESKEAVANNRMAITFIDQIIASLKAVCPQCVTSVIYPDQ